MKYEDQTLQQLECEASRLSHGFYWTTDYLAVIIGCYCAMGGVGMLALPFVLLVPMPGKLSVVFGVAIWYAVWFIVAPPLLRRHFAIECIKRGGEIR
jgi:hypothetical protein